MRPTHFDKWVCSWIDLFSSMIGIITLGHYIPNWGMSWLFHCVLSEENFNKE